MAWSFLNEYLSKPLFGPLSSSDVLFSIFLWATWFRCSTEHASGSGAVPTFEAFSRSFGETAGLGKPKSFTTIVAAHCWFKFGLRRLQKHFRKSAPTTWLGFLGFFSASTSFNCEGFLGVLLAVPLCLQNCSTNDELLWFCCFDTLSYFERRFFFVHLD